MNLDFRTMDLKPFMEIFPVTIPLSVLSHYVLVQEKTIEIPAPARAVQYPCIRPSYETLNTINLDSFGPMESAPLGSVVHARSGDKANHSNIEFFVRHEDEYPWLQNFLTVHGLKMLFGDDWLKGDPNRRVEHCEFPNILAVHL